MSMSFETRPGTWCDVDPGVMAYVAPGATPRVYAVVNGVVRWSIPEPSPPSLYLRVAMVDGVVCVVVQGQDGLAWLTVDGRSWLNYGRTFGADCFLVLPDKGRFRFLVFRDAPGDHYSDMYVGLDGTKLGDEFVFRCDATTQGFLDWNPVSGYPVMTDKGRLGPYGLLKPNRDGGLTVAQHPERWEMWGVGPDKDGDPVPFKIADGLTHQPRVAMERPGVWTVVTRSDGYMIVATCKEPFVYNNPNQTGGGGGGTGGGDTGGGGTPVDSDRDTSHAAMRDTLDELRSKIRPNFYDEEDPRWADVLNQACLAHPERKYGMYAGGHIDGPNGSRIGFDYIYDLTSNELFDVFEADDHHVGWRKITDEPGHPAKSNFVAPDAKWSSSGGGGGGSDTGGGGTGGGGDNSGEVDALRAEVAALRQTVSLLTARLDSFAAQEQTQTEMLVNITQGMTGVLRDGDEVALRTINGKYVCAELGGGGEVNATRDSGGAWETFKFEKK